MQSPAWAASLQDAGVEFFLLWERRHLVSRQLSITLPSYLAEQLEQRVASGAYADRSEVISDGLRELFTREEAVDAWLRNDVASA